MEAFAAPWHLAARMAGDPGYGACWLKDLQYYKACDFFNGRQPPRTTALEKFL
jgi:diphthamide synthase subunit DPH2